MLGFLENWVCFLPPGSRWYANFVLYIHTCIACWLTVFCFYHVSCVDFSTPYVKFNFLDFPTIFSFFNKFYSFCASVWHMYDVQWFYIYASIGLKLSRQNKKLFAWCWNSCSKKVKGCFFVCICTWNLRDQNMNQFKPGMQTLKQCKTS